ncbi:hypothetical protein EOM09_05325 [bacterium]|nr:hypothetical protein [bacterium]
MKDLTIKDKITEFIIYKAPNEEIKNTINVENDCESVAGFKDRIDEVERRKYYKAKVFYFKMLF